MNFDSDEAVLFNGLSHHLAHAAAIVGGVDEGETVEAIRLA